MNPETRQRIAAYLLGDLAPDQALALEREALADPAMAGEVRRMRRLVQALREGGAIEALFEVSDEAMARVVAGAPRPSMGLAGAVRALIATLGLDSLRGIGATAHVRGGTSTGRRLIYFAEGIEIDLRVEGAIGDLVNPLVEVMGHVDGLSGAGRVVARLGEREVAEAEIGAEGFFEMRLPGGVYDLVIESPGARVEVLGAEIMLGTPPDDAAPGRAP